MTRRRLQTLSYIVSRHLTNMEKWYGIQAIEITYSISCLSALFKFFLSLFLSQIDTESKDADTFP